MSKGLVFWLLMVIAAAFWFMGYPLPGMALIFALLFLLGWHCFGFIVQ